VTRLANAPVLNTGGAGFIRSYLVGRLLADAEVRVLDDLSIGPREHVHDKATLRVGDVREEDTVREAIVAMMGQWQSTWSYLRGGFLQRYIVIAGCI
jgi:nucleoside-diphosphate-sugar epimerase